MPFFAFSKVISLVVNKEFKKKRREKCVCGCAVLAERRVRNERHSTSTQLGQCLLLHTQAHSTTNYASNFCIVNMLT